MGYRFRLRFSAKTAGILPFDVDRKSIELGDGLTADLVARNAETIAGATSLHLEAGGFETEQAARDAGERARVRMRLLNAILSLGLNVPATDTPTPNASQSLKYVMEGQSDLRVMDGVWGLAVYPDDDKHLELSIDAELSMRLEDPEYICETLQALWQIDCDLDQASEVALHLLGGSILEGSDKAAFLTCYLALEQLIERLTRAGSSFELIQRFKKQVDRAAERKRNPISAAERASLRAALDNLKRESFKSALLRFAAGIEQPKAIRGVPLKKFLVKCVDTRNRIAHGGTVDGETLTSMVHHLRQIVLTMIWRRNRLPRLDVQRPTTIASMPRFSIRLL